MLNHVAIHSPEASRRIYSALSEAGDTPGAADAAAFLRSQLAATAAFPASLPVRYDELAAWISHHAQSVTDAYHRYQVAREFGAPRRHFATLAQARQFLREAAPARLADGASLYGVVERWDDVDFQPMIASYLELLGHGVPDRNRYLLYRDLLAGGTGGAGNPDTGAAGLPLASYHSAALELSLAHNGEDFLPELIGYNVARQQPSAQLLVARHELAELGLQADAFAGAAIAAGSGPSALLTLRGVMTRVGDPAAFYRRVADGYRLHALAAQLPLPSAADAAPPLSSESPATQPAGAPGMRAAAAPLPASGQQPASPAAPGHAAASTGKPREPALPPDAVADRSGANADAGPAARPAPEPAPAGGAGEPQHRATQLATAEAPQRVRTDRPVIRHHFPADEHAWESIGCELRLLEARLAASDSKEEAMATLARLLAPSLQHTPAGLMAARIYTQLFNL